MVFMGRGLRASAGSTFSAAVHVQICTKAKKCHIHTTSAGREKKAPQLRRKVCCIAMS